MKSVGPNLYADALCRTPKSALAAKAARSGEASQDGLRKSIAETERLVGESDKMLRRHRKECEEDDA